MNLSSSQGIYRRGRHQSRVSLAEVTSRDTSSGSMRYNIVVVVPLLRTCRGERGAGCGTWGGGFFNVTIVTLKNSLVVTSYNSSGCL